MDLLKGAKSLKTLRAEVEAFYNERVAYEERILEAEIVANALRTELADFKFRLECCAEELRDARRYINVVEGDLTTTKARLGEAVGIKGDLGPQPVVMPQRLTCTGCRHLKTKWWKDYLGNDETDSGTSARCGALPDEHGGKSITAYWMENGSAPSWCPHAFLTKQEPSHD